MPLNPLSSTCKPLCVQTCLLTGPGRLVTSLFSLSQKGQQWRAWGGVARVSAPAREAEQAFRSLAVFPQHVLTSFLTTHTCYPAIGIEPSIGSTWIVRHELQLPETHSNVRDRRKACKSPKVVSRSREFLILRNSPH